MTQIPSMPLFVDAYMADTMHLTEAEDGVYMRLLMCMWRMGGQLPNDDARLARFARVSKAKWLNKYRPVLEPFFTISGDFLTQKRLKKEFEHVTEKIERLRENGKRGGRPKSPETNETAKAKGSDLLNQKDNQTAKQMKSTQPQPHSNPNGLQPPCSPPSDGEPEFELLPLVCDQTDEGLAVKSWNAMAERLGLPTVQKVTDARRKKLKARLKDCGGLDGWEVALEKVEGSPFLTGRNDRNWRADFDFLMQESSFVKLMEGRYDPTDGGGSDIMAAFDDLAREAAGHG